MPERIDVIHLSDLESAVLQQDLRQRQGTGPASPVLLELCDRTAPTLG
jgi:hypothetical protein